MRTLSDDWPQLSEADRAWLIRMCDVLPDHWPIRGVRRTQSVVRREANGSITWFNPDVYELDETGRVRPRTNSSIPSRP